MPFARLSLFADQFTVNFPSRGHFSPDVVSSKA